jgi:hypothetical protein
MFHARSTWVHPAPPITGPAMRLDRVDTIAFHYPAGNTPDGDPTDRTDIAAFLRAVQLDYERNRGYSIGYGFAFDHRGDVWELRGWDIATAANKGHNGHTLAFLLIVDQDAGAPPAMVSTIREYVAEAERRTGRRLELTGHGRLQGAATACPGAPVLAQLDAGLFRPTTAPSAPPTPMEDEVMIARRVRMRGTKNVFLIGAGPATHLTPELNDAYDKAGVPMIVVEFHAQFALSAVAQAGLTLEDLDRFPEGV